MPSGTTPGKGVEPVHEEAVDPLVVGEGLALSPTYADRFVLTTEVRASPHEWAAAAFEEGIPRASRDLIFQRALGLRTGPDGMPGSVAGWRIEAEDERSVSLAASGDTVAGRLVVECREGAVSLTTVLGFASAGRRAVWRVLSREHRRVAAPTLRRAAELLRKAPAR